MYITAAPTGIPSMSPTMAPVTSVPSASPSITGAVATVSMSGVVSDELTTAEISSLVSDLAAIYGVSTEDVDLSVGYVASGTLDVVIPEGVTEEEALSALQQSLSDVLGVHPKDVVVSIDSEGVVSYQISGETYEEVESVITEVNTEDFIATLSSELAEGDSGVTVSDVSVSSDVESVISATVDTTDATGDVENAATAVQTLTETYGLSESSAESNFISSVPEFYVEMFSLHRLQHLFLPSLL